MHKELHEKFNNAFEINGDLKITELQNELVKQFNDIGFSVFNLTKRLDTELQENYLSFGAVFNWGEYVYEITVKKPFDNVEDVLMLFFLLYSKKEKVENFSKDIEILIRSLDEPIDDKLKEIIKTVYKQED